MLHKTMNISCFSPTVRRRNTTDSVKHVQLCFQIFFVYYYISFLPAREAANYTYYYYYHYYLVREYVASPCEWVLYSES